jgi:hypothetical protein
MAVTASKPKRPRRSRTLWFNTIVVVLAAIEANLHLVQDALQPAVYLGAIGLIAGLNFYLRTITKAPISRERQPPTE